MDFIADKQTTGELGLLGKYQPDSMFSLFNRTRTKGGARLLEELLRFPLTTFKAIEERKAVVQKFQQAGYEFPVEGAAVDAVADWLDNGAAGTRLGVALAMLKKKGLSFLVNDERYRLQVDWLLAVAEVFSKLHEFLASRKIVDAVDAGGANAGGMNADRASGGQAPHPYEQKIARVKTILCDQRLERLMELGKSGRRAADVSLTAVIYYESLLKNTLGREVESILSFIYELDVYIAVSIVGREKGFGYAKALREGQRVLRVRNLRHPSLKDAVGNDLELDGRRNVLFLTGANMAGKSTLMKSIGIALYLAHAGFPVAADAMEFTLMDGLFSSINVPDNILLGYSHFYAEVLRVKEAAALVAQGHPMLVMFDELFKGTNVKDAYEGTLEVVKAFSAYRNCIFIVSTHLIEVAAALRGFGNLQFAYMPTIMEGSRPRYPYRLAEGVSADRQGMLIIRQEGIPDLLKKK